eukprot:2339672-Rhodomonas_salina.1
MLPPSSLLPPSSTSILHPSSPSSLEQVTMDNGLSYVDLVVGKGNVPKVSQLLPGIMQLLPGIMQLLPESPQHMPGFLVFLPGMPARMPGSLERMPRMHGARRPAQRAERGPVTRVVRAVTEHASSVNN